MKNYYEIKREHNHIDIFLNFPKNKWVIIIENKIEHTERVDQIKDYQNFIENKFSHYIKKLFIFLTKDGRTPATFEPAFTDHLNINLSYSDIGSVISQITPLLNNKLEKIICEEFMEHINNDLSTKLDQLCSRLYKEYPTAIDFLIKNSIPYLEKFEKIFQEITDKYKLNFSWHYPRVNYGRTQYAYKKESWGGKVEVIFFISQNPNSLYWLYVVPATDKKTKESLYPNSKIEYCQVREYEENWNYFSIKSTVKLISEAPLEDFNAGVLSNKVEQTLKSVVEIADEYSGLV